MFKNLTYLLFLVSFPVILQAQYTDLINSNYPGFSQSPYSVGLGVYQLESNFFRKKAVPIVKFDNPMSFGVNLHFRTTFMFERLELNIQSALQNDQLSFKNVFTTTQNKFAVGQLTLGAKYLVYVPEYEDKTKQVRSWKNRHGFGVERLIPHVGLYVGTNVGNILAEYHKKGGLSAKVGVLLQHELDLRTNVVSNVYYNYIGTDFAEWEYIITGTYVLNGRWSGFLEHQATFNKYEKKSNVGGGLAYLFTRDLQVNCSARATFQESGLGSYFSAGASYRFDRHEDQFDEIDENGNKIEDAEGVKKEGFFKRMWNGVKGIFKKKETLEYETKNENGEVEKKEVEVEIASDRTRKKSVLGGIVKKDKKAKKKKTRAEKKAERNKTKAEQKAADKAKRKAAKAVKKARKEKQEKRLDRIKELEKMRKKVLKQQEEFFGKGNIPSNKTDKEKVIDQEIDQIQKDMEEDKILYEEEDKLAREEEALRKEEEKLREEEEKLERAKQIKEKENSKENKEDPKLEDKDSEKSKSDKSKDSAGSDKIEESKDSDKEKKVEEEEDEEEEIRSPWDREEDDD